jgi:hypothetical protein
MQPTPEYSLPNIIALVANGLTIVVSLIAIYLFLWKRKSISTAIRLLLNYSFHITLSELTSKLDRIVDLRSGDREQKEEIICLLNEIVGQVRGNRKLYNACENLIRRLTKYLKEPDKISDPATRSFISELREILRHINIRDYDDILGESQ